MSQFPIVPSDKPGLTVWADKTGKPYIVKQQSTGEISFTPLETALTQLQPQAQSTRQHDPLALLGIAIAGTLGIAIGGYFIGFLAGNHGREPIIIPRSPICRTQESSFLFWNSRREDCK